MLTFVATEVRCLVKITNANSPALIIVAFSAVMNVVRGTFVKYSCATAPVEPKNPNPATTCVLTPGAIDAHQRSNLVQAVLIEVQMDVNIM